jgi:hypothetical protein
MSGKYKIVDGSETGHCCFEASMIDTSQPENHSRSKFACVGEFFERGAADEICRQANAIGNLIDALKAAVSQLPDRCEHEREMARFAIDKAEGKS